MDPNLTVLDGAAMPEIRFSLLSREGEFITAEVNTQGKKIFRGIASSTTRDLHGDVITKSGLDDMERTAVGLTIFLNHSYEVPEDVGGTCTKAIVKQKGVDQDGEPNWILDVESEVEEENERALKSWRMIKNGRKLGISIGAMIPKGGAIRQKDGSYIIEHIQLLEYSIVGIPANPKSWVEYAASALRGYSAAKTTQLGNPTLTLDGDVYKIEGSIQGLELNLGGGETIVVEKTVDYTFASLPDGKTYFSRSLSDAPDAQGMATVTMEPLGAWDLSDPEQLLAAKATVGEDIVTKATVWVETRDGDTITIGEPPADTSAAADPEVTLDVDPDVTDAKVRIIEVDTDSPESGGGQGASDSEPDDANLSAPPADAGTEPLILEGTTEDELVKLSFGQLQAAALAAVTQLVETKRLYAEEKAARITAESQRDAVIEAAGELVQRTAALVEKIADSPLTRKSVATDIKQVSASIEAYYGEDFARALASMRS